MGVIRKLGRSSKRHAYGDPKPIKSSVRQEGGEGLAGSVLFPPKRCRHAPHSRELQVHYLGQPPNLRTMFLRDTVTLTSQQGEQDPDLSQSQRDAAQIKGGPRPRHLQADSPCFWGLQRPSRPVSEGPPPRLSGTPRMKPGAAVVP